MNSGIRNNENCPRPRPFTRDAGKVVDNVPYDCLPSYLRNPNAVLDEDDGSIQWTGGRQPDFSSVDALFNRGDE